MSQTKKLYTLLEKKGAKGVTVREAQKRGINEPRKRVYDLRQEGEIIDTVTTRKGDTAYILY
jgi:hypothetical protein